MNACSGAHLPMMPLNERASAVPVALAACGSSEQMATDTDNLPLT